ncbi:phosphoribosyltransferase [Acuticoccus kandeliae]|uniref:phosphoribosyltransferase n=1 Tax=Acuticoccus kandeliae TaxID=2073160 RepID=UPI000D3EA8F8|nr:phosphoribosyltransferase family protein [Acuticoccus kandeliae]
MRFMDRGHAGRHLAAALADEDIGNALVLALPRGGVPVGAEIADALHLPFDLMLVRKLGVPGDEEIAMGAIAYGDVVVLNEFIIDGYEIADSVVEDSLRHARRELVRRNDLYRGGRAAPNVAGRRVILVDDGVATGADMRAAVESVDQQGADHIIVAVPVASRAAILLLREVADEVITLCQPDPFMGVGDQYENFAPVSDAEVVNTLNAVHAPALL